MKNKLSNEPRHDFFISTKKGEQQKSILRRERAKRKEFFLPVFLPLTKKGKEKQAEL